MSPTLRPTIAALPTAPCAWMRHVALLNDYVRIPYANGCSFASQFLSRELSRRGHRVTVVGPHDPEATADELPPSHVTLPALPLRNHPGVHLALPTPESLQDLRVRRFDLVLGQTCNALMQVGVHLRQTQRIPFLMVNTLHLPSAYVTLVPDAVADQRGVRYLFEERLVPFAERQTARTYDQSDGLIVLSPGMKRYWERLGVQAPIHVIPRAIEPKIFDRPAGPDPFPASAARGGRLLVVCRHVREKGLSQLLRIVAEHVLPQRPDVTLTLVGDGADSEAFRAEAEALGILGATHWLGELPQTAMVDYYAHADLFTYTSLSETYGQVVSEALYCGAPVVALADQMGVSGQVTHDRDGLLVDPARPDADAAMGQAITALLADPARRHTMRVEAMRRARLRGNPERVVARYHEAFEAAQAHCAAHAPRGRQRSDELKALARWAGLNGVASALGLLRAPVQVNRNRARPPSWTLETVDRVTREMDAERSAA